MKTAHGIDDIKAEARMKALGIEYKPTTIPMSTINRQESRHNKAREEEALNQSNVDDIQVAIRAGVILERLVVAPLPSNPKEYVILGGNHRDEAYHREGFTHVEVYLVDPKSASAADIFETLPRTLNRDHGLKENKETAIRSAIREIRQERRSIKAAAEDYGLSEDMLRIRVKHSDVVTLLEEHGVPISDLKKTKTTLACLADVRLDNVRIAAGRIAVMGQLSRPQLIEFVEQLGRASSSEAAQMAVVHKTEIDFGLNGGSSSSNETDSKGTNPGPTTRQPRLLRTKFLQWVSAGERYLAGKRRLSQLQINKGDEEASVSKRLDQIKKKLHALINA